MRRLKAVRNNATVTIPKLDLVYDDSLSARKINVVKQSLEQLASELQALQESLIETLGLERGHESFLSREWPNFVHASKKLFALMNALKIEHHCLDQSVADLISQLLALDEKALPTRDSKGLTQFLQHIIALSTVCQSQSPILETSLDQLQRELESNTVMNLSGLSLVLDLDTLNDAHIDAHISSVTQGLLGLRQQAEDLTEKVSRSNVLIETPNLLSAECDQLMQASKHLLALMSTLGFEAEFNAETPLADPQYQNEHCVVLHQLIVQFESLSPDHAQYYESLETTRKDAALHILLCIDHSGMLDRLEALQAFCIKNNTILDVTQDTLTLLHQSINAHRRSSKNPSVPSVLHEADIEQAHARHHQQRLEAIQGFQDDLNESSITLRACLRPETVLGAQTVSDSEAGGASELGTSLSLQLNAVERLVHIEQRRTNILLELSQFNMQVLGKSTQQSGETPTFLFDSDSYLQLLNQARTDSTQFGLSSLDEDQFYSQYLKPLFDLQHAQLAVFDPDAQDQSLANAQDQSLANKTPQEELASLKKLEGAWGALARKCNTLLASENGQYQSDHRLFDLAYQHMAQIYLEPVKIDEERVGVLQNLNQCLLTYSHAVVEGEGLSESELMEVYDNWLKEFLIQRAQGQMILNQIPTSVKEVSDTDRHQEADACKTLEALKKRMEGGTSATEKLQAYDELYPGNKRSIALLTKAHAQLIKEFSPSIAQHNQAIKTARDTVGAILLERCPDALTLSNMYRSQEVRFKNICFHLSSDDQKSLIEQILRSGIQEHLGPESQEAEKTYINLVKESLISEHAGVIQADIQNQVLQAEEKVDQFLKANEDAIFKCFATQNRIVGLIGTEAASQDEAAECAVPCNPLTLLNEAAEPYDPLTLLNSLSRSRDIDLSDSNQAIEAHAASEEEPAAEDAAEDAAAEPAPAPEPAPEDEAAGGAPNAEPAADAILEDTLYSRLALEPALIQLRMKYDERRQYVSGQFISYLSDTSESISADFSHAVLNCAEVLKAETHEADEQSPLLPHFDSKLFRSAEDYKACVDYISGFYRQFDSLQAMEDAHRERRDDNRRSMTKRSMGFGVLGSFGLAAWRLELTHLMLNGISVAGVSIAPIVLGFSIVCLAIPVLLLIKYRAKPYKGFNPSCGITQQDMSSYLRDSSSAFASRSAASFAEVSPASEAPVRFDDAEVRPDNGVRSAEPYTLMAISSVAFN